ncbi:alanine--glyoxylate aminotransferase family protein [Akkermansiaceae bacterium]|jgi:aspartate aminotransferase-like enzyme|nr:alanine--glyoxylate aminotransferase family protein [Verrucomicrobiota bacterium]MDA7861123.1 alanine--glyoxylate aminotransferase family protein [Akkermansiaceae bacterium]MDA7937093.1 alanine--glyoxylate aminotransferase family protein [bacterium]MBT6400646.1 alanine--glyoxylate aminotransferase family protein [Verrucomicrobiota bacterium]MBT7970706.1 alanine--glyoxylate aminotransferase family protein [Verrucomicrobiota bacterium]
MSPALSRTTTSTDWRQFVPGPVPISPHLLTIGAQQLPYNRTETFSTTTHEILGGLRKLFKTESEVVVLTGSGTAAMEASVLNFVGPDDRALVVNGGTFGQRWADLCGALAISHDEFQVNLGAELDLESLETSLAGGQHSVLLINAHETSTGLLYDIEEIGRIARRYDIFFIVDAISSVCADIFEMDGWGVDVAILSSHKALALPPGLSFVAMGERAVARLDGRHAQPKSLYFDLKNYLDNQQRGQLPYTPAIGLMLQLQARLRDIHEQPLTKLISQHQQRAEYFRNAIQEMPFDILPARPSNAITALSCRDLDASEVAEELRDRYHLIVAPSGGVLKSKLIRISHMGAQDQADVRRLVTALGEIVAQPNSIKI